MPFKKGAVVSKKGRFFVISLMMARDGVGKDYATPYGTYVRMEEAKKKCQVINKVITCNELCHFKKICQI